VADRSVSVAMTLSDP